MAEIEDDFKVRDWLEVMTFDAYKYIKAGGKLVIEQDNSDMVLRVVNVDINSDGVDRRLRRHIAGTKAEKVEETTEI